MTPLLYIALLGCTPRDSGHAPDKDSPHDTGTVDSPTDSAETAESGDTAETAETADTGETADTDTDTGVDTAPPPCDRSLGWSFVACGYWQTCGIHTDGCAECWGRGQEDDDTSGYDTGGRYHWHGEDEPPDGTYTFLAMNASPMTNETPNACGILDDGSALCWGSNRYGVNDVPVATYNALAVWEYGAYGLREDGLIEEWGYGLAPPGEYTAMATGEYHAVFLQPNGELYQIPKAGLGEEASPAGTYTDVGMGNMYACAISTDGTILCWDPDDPDNGPYESLTVNAPTGVWKDVCDLGGGDACALDIDGHATCWPHGDSYPAPPDELFVQLACGASHACGITFDERLVCWGPDRYGETIPPT